MKKQKIFRADGASLGGINASSGTYTKDDLGNIKTVCASYSYARVGVNQPKTVRVSAVNEQLYGKSVAEALVSLLKKASVNIKSYDRTSNTGNSLILKCGTESDAKKTANAVNAILQLGTKVLNLTDTYTIDPQYSKGLAIQASSGGFSVSYWIPYNAQQAAAATQAQTEAASAQQAQADADLAAEEALRKTTTGRVLRIAGIVAFAALVIGIVVFIIVKSKKK